MATDFRVLTASMSPTRMEQIKPLILHQGDYGRILRLTDVELPEYYEVHFGYHRSGISKPVIGNRNGVEIPNEFLNQPGTFYAWFYLHDSDTDGETRYELVFKVIGKANAWDEPLPPEQRSIADQLIGALSSGVEQTRDLAEDAEQFKMEAEEAAETAAEILEEIKKYKIDLEVIDTTLYL